MECSCGNEFETVFEKITGENKKQCTECGYKQRALDHRLSEDKIKEFVESNSDCTLISTFRKEDSLKRPIIHLNLICGCGNEFSVSWKHFKNSGQHSCRTCQLSKGERAIEQFFKKNNICYKPQVSFDDLVGDKGWVLRFDFGVYKDDSLQFLLEYDGIQHYQKANCRFVDTDETFELRKRYDYIKNEYSVKNCIPLYRIPYWHFNNIEDILKEIIDFHNNGNTEITNRTKELLVS